MSAAASSVYDVDVAIAGGGHNALACGAALARAGLTVLVAERNAWLGGGAVTRELSLPGFRHDLFGSNHVCIHANPFFRELLPQLERYGLRYLWAENEIMGHPLWEGPGIIVYRDVERTCDSIAEYSKADARRYREIHDGFAEIKDGFAKNMFSPPKPPSALAAALERSPEGLRMLRNYSLSARAFVHENFTDPRVQAFLLSWALGPNIKPSQQGAGSTFYIMIPAIHVFGQAIPAGGSIQLPIALGRYIEDHGGTVLTNAAVRSFIVHQGTARGLRLADGREVRARRAVVTALEPKQTFLELLREEDTDAEFRRMVRNFTFGEVASFRVHFALHEPPQYRGSPQLSRAPFQRTIAPLEEIDRHFAAIDLGELPEDSPIHAHCWTLRDPTRAPPGKHTLMIDTFVPSRLQHSDWQTMKGECERRLVATLRRHTTNMGDANILAQFSHSPLDMEALNPCFVGGVPSGGERTPAQMGYFRPFPGYSHYRAPVRRLYMAGPSCHPGGGISGMGVITANVMLEDFARESGRG